MFSMLVLAIVVLGLVSLMTFKNSHSKHKSLVKATGTSKRERHATNTTHPFHCVSIENAGNCCEQADAIKGKRFLSKEAPELPMKACSQSNCQCHYQHYDDRRQAGSDRRIDYGMTKELYGAFGEHNRRESPKGRRSTDH
ncbi:hypothetical protein [Shewanella decolorationis]|uniref:Uncharacterized protein n=2 Tax=Shewanella decolorationis TaxID=256839 RepID=A0A5B8QV48_9GAMM|nr:hypothetical protein [Shewanella decolorationis]QDZ89797.1 hypothetical protein D0436_04525 [Shewanella decolorationis]GLR33141.1 hypothetical protein GCM10007922_27000 [Shewanella decolorationis]